MTFVFVSIVIVVVFVDEILRDQVAWEEIFFADATFSQGIPS
jgi:hypothetical protein